MFDEWNVLSNPKNILYRSNEYMKMDDSGLTTYLHNSQFDAIVMLPLTFYTKKLYKRIASRLHITHIYWHEYNALVPMSYTIHVFDWFCFHIHYFIIAIWISIPAPLIHYSSHFTVTQSLLFTFIQVTTLCTLYSRHSTMLIAHIRSKYYINVGNIANKTQGSERSLHLPRDNTLLPIAQYIFHTEELIIQFLRYLASE